MPEIPSEAQVLQWMDELSNWGRWGDDDQLGTLNQVTPEVRRAAAALVSEGVSVSCAWDIENTHEPDHAMGTPQRFMVMTGESAAAEAERGARMAGALEFFGLVYHGYAITHLDSLCHIFWDGQMYNGKPAHLVNSMAGATHHAITELKDGIVTRGVMLDIAALKGVDWLDPGEGVFPRGPRGGRRAPGRQGAVGRRRAAAHRLRQAQARGRPRGAAGDRLSGLARRLRAVDPRARRLGDRRRHGDRRQPLRLQRFPESRCTPSGSWRWGCG